MEKTKKNYHSLKKWWEAGKIYFKILAIQFSTFQNQKRKKDLQNLTQKILKEKIKTTQDQNKIQNWQNQIDDIENYQKMGSVIRSKEKLIVNEEIPNKFFYQTEKINQTKKQIITLQNEQNKTLGNNHEILKECHNYYQQLYKKQNNCKLTQEQLLINIPKLVTTNQNKQLTKTIQKSKLKQAIEQTENEKSPGIEGIPIEFYKTFMIF